MHLKRNKPLVSLCRFLAGTASAVCIAVWGASAQPWPLFRGGLERTGTVSHRTGLPGASPAWTVRLGAPVIGSLVAGRGMVFAGAGDTVYALDSASGRIRWRTGVGGVVDAAPALIGDTLIVGTRAGAIVLIQSRSGVKIRTLPAAHQLSSAAVTPIGEIVVGMGHPLNRLTVFAPGSLQPWSVFFGQPCYTSPAVTGRRVVIGANDGKLRCVSLDSRQEMWVIPTPGEFYLSTPAIVGERVYFAPGGFDRDVYCADLSTGGVIWKNSGVPSEALITQRSGGLGKAVQRVPLASDRALYDRLHRLSPTARYREVRRLAREGIDLGVSVSAPGLGKRAASGAAEQFIAASPDIKTSSVAADAHVVAVVRRELGYTADLSTPVSRYTLQVHDAADGRLLWTHADVCNGSDQGYNASPIITPGAVFYAWGDGRVGALNRRSGSLVWSAVLDSHVVSSPAINGTSLYLATVKGTVTGWNLTETAEGVDFQTSTYCFPNPAPGKTGRMATTIQVFVKDAAAMTLRIDNNADKPVLHVERDLPAGKKYTHRWDLGSVANGVYYARITVQYRDGRSERKTVKIAVLK